MSCFTGMLAWAGLSTCVLVFSSLSAHSATRVLMWGALPAGAVGAAAAAMHLQQVCVGRSPPGSLAGPIGAPVEWVFPELTLPRRRRTASVRDFSLLRVWRWSRILAPLREWWRQALSWGHGSDFGTRTMWRQAPNPEPRGCRRQYVLVIHCI